MCLREDSSFIVPNFITGMKHKLLGSGTKLLWTSKNLGNKELEDGVVALLLIITGYNQ